MWTAKRVQKRQPKTQPARLVHTTSGTAAWDREDHAAGERGEHGDREAALKRPENRHPPAGTASGTGSLGVLFKYPSALRHKRVVTVWFSAKENQKTVPAYCAP